LKKLGEKAFFTKDDVAEIFGIKSESAKVLCTRFTKKGIFIRLKKNFYILSENLEKLNIEDLFKISNYLQVPSYISFLTALSYYGVSTQIQRGFIESASTRRTRKFKIQSFLFNFYKIKKNYYFGFVKENDIFIATKEKALVDSVYLYSFGKYKLDFSAIDFNKIDRAKLREVIDPFPERTKKILKKICRI